MSSRFLPLYCLKLLSLLKFFLVYPSLPNLFSEMSTWLCKCSKITQYLLTLNMSKTWCSCSLVSFAQGMPEQDWIDYENNKTIVQDY